MATNPTVEAFGTVTDEAANNQIVLRFVQVPVAWEGKAYDFYSLDWEIKGNC